MKAGKRINRSDGMLSDGEGGPSKGGLPGNVPMLMDRQMKSV